MRWLFRLILPRRPAPVIVVEAPATDARIVEGHPRRAPDPEVARRRKLGRRGLAFVLGGFILAGGIASLFGEGGWFDLKRLRREVAWREAELAATTERVERLAAEVAELREDTLARERIARERLGFQQPGEIDFLLPRSEEPKGFAAPPPPAERP